MASVTRQGEAPATTERGGLGVHVLETGRLVANRTFLRGEGFGSLLRPIELFDFPALAFVIEHPEGLIAIDTGLGTHVPKPRTVRGFPPTPATSEEQEIGPQLRRRGLDPADVKRVVLTHLDWDHTAGLRHFPEAEVLLHRREHAAAQTRIGRLRYQPSVWPDGFRPVLYDLEPEPYGPFPASRAVTASGDVRLVPLPGHSPGQVGVVYETPDATVLFCADHMLRADWLVADLAAGRLLMLGVYGKKDARETSRRLEALLRERPVILVPSHDADAEGRLARREPTRV